MNIMMINNLCIIYHVKDGEDGEPLLKLTHNCGESVTSAEGGVVGHQVTTKDDFLTLLFPPICALKAMPMLQKVLLGVAAT